MIGLLHKSSSSAIQQSVATSIDYRPSSKDYRSPRRRLSLLVDSGNCEGGESTVPLLVPTRDSSRMPPTDQPDTQVEVKTTPTTPHTTL